MSVAAFFPTSRPRALVRINNAYSLPPMRYTITSNGHGVLDSAEVTLPIKDHPDWASIIPPGQPIPIVIYAGFPANPDPGGFSYRELSIRFSGTIDPIDPTFNVDDQSVSLHCLSFGSALSIGKTTTNLGASGSTVADLGGVKTTQYVAMVAKRFGMNADIQVKNPWTLQDVYSAQQIVGIHNLRFWDILVACAQTDGAYVWFSGDNTLHYVDPALIQRKIYPVQYGSLRYGIKGFTGSHSPQFNKNIKVEVRSYKDRVSSRSRVSANYDETGNMTSVQVHSTSRTFTHQNFGNPGESVVQHVTHYNADGTTTVTSVAGSSLSSGGETSTGFLSMGSESLNEPYIYKFHNLTQAQCDQRALIIWKWLSSHEYRGTFKLPIDEELLPYADITTKWRVGDMPWASFSQDYIALRNTETFEEGGGRASGGWELEVLGINHRLPQGML